MHRLFSRDTCERFTASIRSISILTALLLLTSCTTTNIAGLDRIFFPNSSAKVGPLVSTEEQYPSEEEQVSTGLNSTANASAQKALEQKVQVKSEQSISKPAIQDKSAPLSTIQTEKPSQAAKVIKKSQSSPSKATETATKKLVNQESKKAKAVPSKIATGSINGKVVLIDGNGKPLPAIGTLVSLTPMQQTGAQQSRKPKTHIIDMEQKEYQPRYSTINAGDQVVFVNKDNIRHNVFSSSGSNAFDLGTYGAGLKRAVTLDQPGIVKIYCNIHANMATFVAVGDQNLSTNADESGRYQLNNLAAGTYELSIWNIRGELKRTIEVKANDALALADKIDTTAFKIDAHKNKFGGKYSKNASLFEDEFY